MPDPTPASLAAAERLLLSAEEPRKLARAIAAAIDEARREGLREAAKIAREMADVSPVTVAGAFADAAKMIESRIAFGPAFVWPSKWRRFVEPKGARHGDAPDDAPEVG